MSAELLRRAAALMRERASGATTGPWSVAPAPDATSHNRVVSDFIVARYPTVNPTVAVVVSPQYGDTESAEWGQTSDADHIAALPPGVVLASALIQHAEDHDGYDECRWEPCGFVDFARAYLGEGVDA